MTMLAATPEEALLRMMDDAATAPEFDDLPPEARPGAVVRQPTQDEPFGSVVSEVSGPGWVYLYNTETGEQVKVNRWNLEDARKKKHSDPAHPEYLGKPLFSTRKTKEYVLGIFKCHLHREHEGFPLYQSWGMKPCMAAHIPSPFEVTRHMEKRHKSEWAAIKAHHEEQRRQEDRAEQREILRVLAQRATLEPATVEAKVYTRPCDVCGDEFEGVAAIVVTNKIRAHMKAAHSGDGAGAASA